MGSTKITTNNTEVLITDIGEDGSGGLPSLTCHTDLTTCCRNGDNNNMGSLGGEWYYPDGRVVPNSAAGEGFYRIRNAPQVARLARRIAGLGITLTFGPTGTYCCVIPTSGGELTFCAELGQLTGTRDSSHFAYLAHTLTNPHAVLCDLLPPPLNGGISTELLNWETTVTTYTCNHGYVLIGESRRTCQPDRTWTSSAPYCTG